MPTDGSTGPGSTYVYSATYSGTAFLNANNNPTLWNAESAGMNGQNPFVINSTFTSNVNAPTACNSASTTNVCKVTWFINRYYFTVDMKVSNAGIAIACAPGSSCQGYSCFFGQLCNNGVYDGAFQTAMQSQLSLINGVSKLTTPTKLSMQLNLPPLPGGQSNLDYAGILAAYTAPACTNGGATPAAGGTANNDLCTSASGSPASATVVQSAVNTPLPIFSDAAMANRYQANCATYLNAPTYTASQLAGACAASLSSQAYAEVDISSFGAGFSTGPQFNQCGIGNFRACWTVTSPEAVLTVVLDVLTSYHVYQQYPPPTPSTGTSAGGITGKAVDGSLFWNPAVPGAQICLTDISGCTSDNAAGNFNLTNVPAGQHTIQVTAPGYVASAQITVSVGTGGTANVGTISLAETNPWYTGSWCLHTNVVGQCDISIPWLAVFTGVAALVLVLAVVVFVYGGGQRKGVDTALQIARRLTPKNPLTPKGQGFVTRQIAFYINEGEPAKVAQARAFNDARQRGFHVPPPPRK